MNNLMLKVSLALESEIQVKILTPSVRPSYLSSLNFSFSFMIGINTIRFKELLCRAKKFNNRNS